MPQKYIKTRALRQNRLTQTSHSVLVFKSIAMNQKGGKGQNGPKKSI